MVDFKKRCEDCACLVNKNGVWCCDECFGQKCSEIDDCPEGVEGNEVDEMTEKAKEVSKHYEQATKERKKSTRERKVDNEKLAILEVIANSLLTNLNVSATIEKEVNVHFSMNGNDYSIKLTKHRKKS